MRQCLQSKTDEVEAFYRNWLAFQRINRTIESKVGISFTQWNLLRWIFQYPGITAGQLAEKTFLHRSSITPLIKRMIKKGYVSVEVDSWDKRRRFVTITRQGKSALDRANPIVESFVAKSGKLER